MLLNQLRWFCLLALVIALGGTPGNASAQENKPVVAEKDEDVGNKKRMETDVKLYRNGKLSIQVASRSRHATEGLRGRVMVVCVDAKGNAIWVTSPDKCTTRGSVGDWLTPSKGTDSFFHDIPAAVAKATATIDIYHSTGDLNNQYAEWVKKIKTTVRDAKDIAVEIKKAIEELGN